MGNKQTTNIASSYSSSSSSSENVVMDSQQITNFASSSSSSSSSSPEMSRKKYDVFLSFRGEDTRDNFTSHLYDALSRAKVETYIDNRLEKGDGISQALIKAIQDSLVSVVVFSENYASSKWCLDEITMILECKRDHGQIVIPVFYKVDPSHVRKQTGSYKNAFAKHEKNLKKGNNSDDMLQKWRRALNEAANLAGWDSGTSRNESEFIKGIVKDVLQKLNNRYPIELKGVVGIEESYAMVESLMKIGSINDVRVIGIWGMGGIGKTTLARALYAKLSIHFEGYCFLESVSEQLEKNGLDALRNKLFFELLGGENDPVDAYFMTRRHRKVLIVLDDVATSAQLDNLIRDYNSLTPGSRVIVTTRDKRVLSEVNDIYEVKELNNEASLQLFRLNAFREKRPKVGYEELSERVIAYCKGNPLTLKVLGARLRLRSMKVWESDLRKLHKIPDLKIHNVLKLSFDGLDSDEKNIFLDIACFLKGKSRDDVTCLLDACGFFATVGIENLIDKSLLTISNYGSIEMHDLIQEMGWKIVYQESIKDPGRRSRLWDPEEVYDVLKNNKGTEAVENIVLDLSKIKDLHLRFNSFTKMTEIRVLIFYSSNLNWVEGCKIHLPNGLESLSDKLRHLEWHRYCLKYLPSTFCAENLVKLVMSCSNLKKLWNGVQEVVNLKEVDLRCSQHLIELPDLSQATNLEFLNLNECISLREVHPSIFSLPKLWNMDLGGCTKIESLETDIHLKSLSDLNLSGCSSLKKFSVFSKKLERLGLGGTNIHELPTSIWRCEKLGCMSLSGCYNLESFGSNSSHGLLMQSLWYLDLSGSKLVDEYNLCLILDGMRSLTWLSLEDCCNLRALPDSIDSLTLLSSLTISGSINVEMLSPNMKNLLNLKMLRLDNCRKLVSLPELPPSLQQLSAINCTSLQTHYYTQLLSMVEQKISRDYNDGHGRSVIFPGSQIPDMFSIRGEGNSISFPQLPQSGSISHLIFCLVLSHIPPNIKNGWVSCCINKRHLTWTPSIRVADVNFVGLGHSFISDHVLLCSSYDYKSSLLDYWKTHRFGAFGPNDIDFYFYFRRDDDIEFAFNYRSNKIKIKRCAVFPVYASQDEQQTIITVLTERLGGKKEENSRPEEHSLSSIIFTKRDETGYQLVAQAQAFSKIQESIPAGSTDIWNMQPPKIKMFLWKVCSGAILVKSELDKSRLTKVPWCPLCRQEPETISHALLHCSWTRPVWHASQLQLNPSSEAVQDFQTWFMEIVHRLKSNKEFLSLGLSILAQTIWYIWKERNDCYFQSRQPNPIAVVMKINAQVASWSTRAVLK